MTADSRLICRRCGFHNVPGDQFCGSCGAFLEWEGEPETDAVLVPASPRDPDVPVVTAAPGPGPAAPAPPRAEAPAPVEDPGLIRCPACGIANAASRTFCQACGTKLADAQRVAQPSAAQIAAAVAASGGPPAATTAAVRTVRTQPEEPSSRGLGRWIVLVAFAGLLIGASVVGASFLLQGEGPASEATSGPSVPGVATASGEAPSGAPGSSAASGAPSAPASGAPAKPVALVLSGATASSVVGDLARFQPASAIDGDPATAWQEGDTVEKGQWIEVAFEPARVTAVILSNGYNASKALYRGNRRLKDVRISVNGGAPVEVRLDDTPEPQRIKLPATDAATTLRITIVSTYAAAKTSVSGTPFDDAALSEIVVLGVPGS